MIWLSGYVIVGCLLAVISLMSGKPQRLSPLAFALAHALWPALLILIICPALSSSRQRH
jgi:hypothetical protein